MRLIAVFTVILLLAAFSIGCASSSESYATAVPVKIPEQTIAPRSAVLTHDLVVTVEPNEAAIILLNPNPIGDRTYVQGRTVTIDVLPKPGWEVDKWLGPVFEFSGSTAKINMNVSHSVIVSLVQSSERLPTQTPTQTPISGRAAKPLPTAATPPTVRPSPTTMAAPLTTTSTPAPTLIPTETVAPLSTSTPMPALRPKQSSGATVPIRAAILEIQCGPEFKLSVHISIKSESGVTSFSVWSTWGSQGTVERAFSPPYPTTIEEVVIHDEEYPDTIDRLHQIGLKVVSPGVADPFLTYGFEPDDRCPRHFLRPSSATGPTIVPVPTPTLIRQPTPGGLMRGATISGRVVDVDTGLPIANVRMRADDPATRRGPRADTGPDGRYSLTVAPGVYIVSADRVAKGYIIENYDDTYAWGDAARFTVIGTEVVEGIDFGLKRGATISGRVIDAVTGLPIVRMDVRAAPANGGADISWGETDLDGRYTLKGIPDGVVEVFVAGQGYILMSKTVAVRNGQNVTGVDF